jgi:hypothetical protein
MPCCTTTILLTREDPSQETFHSPPPNSWINHLVGKTLRVVLVHLDTLASGSARKVTIRVSGLGATALVVHSDSGLSRGRGLNSWLSLDGAASSGLGSTNLLGSLGLVASLSRLGSSRLRLGVRFVCRNLGRLLYLCSRGLLGGLGGRRLLDNRLGLLGLLGLSSGSRLLDSRLAGRGITLIGRELGVVVTLAAADVEEGLGALNLLKGEVGVVGILEPVKSPLATILECLRKAVTLASGGDATVLGTTKSLAELRGATVEDSNTSTRHHKIEVVVTEIASSVGGLDDHGLALDGTGGEGNPKRIGQYERAGIYAGSMETYA